MRLLQHKIPSPIGEMLLITDEQEAVRALDFDGYQSHLHQLLQRHYGDYELVNASHSNDAALCLHRYFSGDLNALEGIHIATNGSPFQQQVWSALRKIPPGQVLSYSDLAAQLGQPKAARTVGGANATNPIAIIVPCHRIIAKNGNLTGFAWGLERKRWLLTHERAALHYKNAAR